MDEITSWHWRLIRHLVDRAEVSCLVPIYPLVPKGTAAEVTAKTAALIENRTTEPPILMGDSAGGGIALAAALTLRDRGVPQPRRLVLISPFLDATLSDPRQPALERTDPMLRRAGLAEAGRAYAAGLSLDDPRVSPLRGDLRGVAPITLFTGTRDLLDADARVLADAADRAGVDVQLRVARGAPHVYPLMPTRQGGAARSEIIEICRQR
jgi:acetyl esterase/lipase